VKARGYSGVSRVVWKTRLMPLEIERKFLVDHEPAAWKPSVTAARAWLIRQGYVTQTGSDPEVRVRHAVPLDITTVLDADPRPLGEAPHVHRLTTKAAIPDREGGAVTRHEVEVDIPATAFGELWAITDGRRVEKVRVEYRFDDPSRRPATFTVDHFRGPLAGLLLAEIEFDDAESSGSFDRPGFLGREVTHDARYRNQALAVMATPPGVGSP